MIFGDIGFGVAKKIRELPWFMAIRSITCYFHAAFLHLKTGGFVSKIAVHYLFIPLHFELPLEGEKERFIQELVVNFRICSKEACNTLCFRICILWNGLSKVYTSTNEKSSCILTIWWYAYLFVSLLFGRHGLHHYRVMNFRNEFWSSAYHLLIPSI